MDRLTFLDNGSPSFICGDWTKVVRKLYAYEGTRLTPEEIEQLKAESARLYKLLDKMKGM